MKIKFGQPEKEFQAKDVFDMRFLFYSYRRYFVSGIIGSVFLEIGVLWILTMLVSATTQAATPTEVPKYGVYEVTLTTTNTHTNPYTDVTLSATFQGPTKMITIEGFWDGGNTWKIRMAPTEVGTWTLIDVVSNDAQLNNQQEGTTFTCREPTAAEIVANEILRHGFIQVNPDYPHTFMHADGTPFFLMGDTAWPRTFWSTYFQDGTFQQLVDGRAAQGFTVFTNAHLGFDDSTPIEANEGGPPFFGPHPSYQLNPEFFQWTDKRMEYMNNRGIRPMMLIGSPDHGLTNNIEWNTRVQRYLIARYAAYDVIWFGVKEYEEWGDSAISTIRAIGNTIEQYDPYGHPASTHTIQSTNELGNDTWLAFNALQSLERPPYTGPGLIGSDGLIQAYENFSKPVVQSEAFYEGAAGEDGGSWHGFTDPQILLEGLWATQLHGGWNAGYQLVVANPNTNLELYLAYMNNTCADYHTYLKKFFEQTEFWKLVPNNNLVVSGTAWAAANPGNEYVLFLKDGGSVTVDLSAASGSLPVEWYNPKTGEFTSTGTTAGGGNQSFTAPFGGSAVLHIVEGDSSPPTITTHPQDKTIAVGETATFSVEVSGTLPLSYQWQKDGVNIEGATSSSYTTPPVSLDDDGATFRCVVSNSLGSATSNEATLTVIEPQLTSITVSPASATVPPGGVQQFTATGLDQFGNPFAITPVWTVSDGGTIDQTGFFTAGAVEGGPFTVTATVDSISGTADVTVVAQLVIHDLIVASGKPYEVVYNGLQIGALAYIDRSYTYSVLPVWLEGATYIKTANNDKTSQGDAFLSFEVNQDVTVYVAHDNRYQTKPDWLSNFLDIGEDLKTTDAYFSLFEKGFSAGMVVLGGNVHPTEAEGNSMYTVIITVSTDTIPPAIISDLKISPGSSDTERTLTWTAPGDDRDVGTAAKYIVKYAVMSIEDKSLFPWDTAIEVSGAPQPQPAGSQESIVVTGLPTLKDGEIYRFAIGAVDDAGNISDLDTEPPSVVSKPKHVDE